MESIAVVKQAEIDRLRRENESLRLQVENAGKHADIGTLVRQLLARFAANDEKLATFESQIILQMPEAAHISTEDVRRLMERMKYLQNEMESVSRKMHITQDPLALKQLETRMSALQRDALAGNEVLDQQRHLATFKELARSARNSHRHMEDLARELPRQRHIESLIASLEHNETEHNSQVNANTPTLVASHMLRAPGRVTPTVPLHRVPRSTSAPPVHVPIPVSATTSDTTVPLSASPEQQQQQPVALQQQQQHRKPVPIPVIVQEPDDCDGTTTLSDDLIVGLAVVREADDPVPETAQHTPCSQCLCDDWKVNMHSPNLCANCHHRHDACFY
eukprot:TRINITY_DN13357_c0_g1_i1.p1 TRINITY_DN13357_c0_g1~~TRINITY_DN13357_c0_g1_i1.p1  ORF type:complete len:334 (+),score=72.26 TRINITY_DN13357_c0_g1_i1:132-1133(+)